MPRPDWDYSNTNFSDPEEQHHFWEEHRRQEERRRMLGTNRGAMIRQAERAAEIAARHPHMTAGAVAGLAQVGAPDEAVDAAAQREEEMLRDDPLWRHAWDNTAGRLPDMGRGLLGLAQGIWWEPIGRPVFAAAGAAERDFKGDLPESNVPLGGWAKAFREEYRDLGDAPVVTMMEDARRGEDVDLRLTGDVWAEHYDRRAEGGSPGRLLAEGAYVLADQTGHGEVIEPGTRAYNFTRALIDIPFEIGTDPTIMVGKTARAAIEARRTFSQIPAAQRTKFFGLAEGMRKTRLAEVRIDNWLQSERGRAAKEFFAGTEDFEKIRAIVRDGEASLALTGARNVDEVESVMRQFAGTRLRGPVDAPTGFRIHRRIEDTKMGRAWEAVGDLMPESARYVRFGNWTPKWTGIPLDNPTEAAEQFSRWFVNWRAPKELASKRVEELTRAVAAGDRHSAWGVWADANADLARELGRRGYDKDVVRSLTRMIGGPDFATGTNQRIYFMENIGKVGPGGVDFNGQIFNGETWVRHTTPHSAVELMDEAIMMPNVLEIRRATGMLSRLNKLGDLGDVLAGLGPHVTGKPKGMIWNVHDALWSATKTAWMPMALVTRIAWPFRVTLEEQLRMAGTGYDSMFHHPISYIGWAIGNPSTRTGRLLNETLEMGPGGAGAQAVIRAMKRQDGGVPNWADFQGSPAKWISELDEVTDPVARANVGFKAQGAQDLLGAPMVEARQHRDAMIMNRPAAYHGPGTPKPGAAPWQEVNMQDVPRHQQIGAMRISMGKMWSDDVKQRVARSILDGDNSLDNVFEWFYGSQLHRGMMRTSDDFAHKLSTPEGVREWLNSQAKELRYITGGDEDLIKSVATREFAGRNMAQTHIDRRAVNSRLSSKVDKLTDEGNLPTFLPAPQELLQPNVVQSWWNNATSQMFYALGAVPSNVLSRSPVFKQAYWRRTTELVEFADEPTQRAILQAAREADLPKSYIDDITARMGRTAEHRPKDPNISTKRVFEVESGGDVVPASQLDDGRYLRSLEEVDILAKEFGLRESNTLLYQLSERGHTMGAMRLIFPFGEAWKEIGLTWSKILGRAPYELRRGQIILDGARQHGFLHVDPATGEESYVSPGASFFENWADLPDDVRASTPTPLRGINLFTGSMLPGVGPAGNLKIGAFIPDHTQAWRDLRDIVLPFGSPAREAHDLLDSDTYIKTLLPAWMEKAYSAITEGGWDQRMFHSHQADAARILAMSGDFDTSTPEGVRQLEEASRELTKKTLWFRGLGQAVLPAGFRVDFQVRPDDPAAQEQMEKVLGEDFEFGRDDEGFLSLIILTSLWHTLREEADGDAFLATKTFLEMFGHDPHNYDLYQWSATIGQGKTLPIDERAQTPEGRAWEQKHSHIVDAIPAVVGFFAPEGNDPEEAALEFLMADIEEGARIQLSGEEFIMASQRLIGSAIYRNAQEQVEGDHSPEARLFKARRRAWLDENLPFWRRDRGTVPERVTMRDRMEQLEEALQFEEVLDTPAGEGLSLYWHERRRALDAVKRNFDDVETDEDAINALRNRNATGAVRETLHRIGWDLILDYPEFGPIWERILIHEVEPEEETE